MIDKELDTGPIIWQKEIPISWEDTGEDVYFKGIKALCKLVCDKKEEILNLKFTAIEQTQGGTFHYKKELQNIERIELEKKYDARSLLNLLRAKSFYPFPGAWFEADGKKYEVRVQIKEVGHKTDVINYAEILKKHDIK